MKKLIKLFIFLRALISSFATVLVIVLMTERDFLGKIVNGLPMLYVCCFVLLLITLITCTLAWLCIDKATTKDELKVIAVVSIFVGSFVGGILMLRIPENQLLPSKKKNNASSIVASVLSYTFLTILAIAILIPFFQMIVNSLKNREEIFMAEFFPTTLAWENYVVVFNKNNMLQVFLNTFMYIIPPVLCGTFMSALCAYGFARMKFPGKNILFSAMMSTMVIPNVIIMTPAYVMFSQFYKWVGTPLPVVVPALFGGTTCMFFMLQYIRTIPKDMEEAAMIDGLSRGGMFVNIIMPLIVPAFVAQAILTFSGQYNDYLTPLLYLGAYKELYTVQLAIQSIGSGYDSLISELLAACTVALIPTIVLFLSAQKTFTEGITLTGVK